MLDEGQGCLMLWDAGGLVVLGSLTLRCPRSHLA